MTVRRHDALVLAAGRGPDDPMAKAFGVTHKCLLDIEGTPMLVRVLSALAASSAVARVLISVEDPDVPAKAAGFRDLEAEQPITTVASADRASSSVLQALQSDEIDFPVLVTTADHALLTPQMIDHFLSESSKTGADVTVGLARAETILGAYPGSARTFLKFAGKRYSGCNLFSFNSPRALSAVRFWQRAEQHRKTPWKLIGTFGIWPLLRYVTGTLDLETAFEGGGAKLGVTAATGYHAHGGSRHRCGQTFGSEAG